MMSVDICSADGGGLLPAWCRAQQRWDGGSESEEMRCKEEWRLDGRRWRWTNDSRSRRARYAADLIDAPVRLLFLHPGSDCLTVWL